MNQNNFPYIQKSIKSESSDFDKPFRATHPANEILIPEHTFIVDSRERNCKEYPDPSNYKIDLKTVYKNITSIELKGSIIPRSSYNIHSNNKYIDFSIGSTITEIKLLDGGSGYTFVPTVTISNPYMTGVQATATAIVNLGTGQVMSILIGVAGSGYIASQPPTITIQPPITRGSRQATAQAIIGTHYTAILREGQYTIGGNPIPPAPPAVPSGLVLEIQNAMNYAVSGTYNVASITPFEVRIVSQYPELDAVINTPEYYNTNACKFNRFQITNVNNEHWELLFCSGPNNKRNLFNVLGFNWMDYYEPYNTPTVSSGASALISAGTTLRADFDYDLLDDPKYIILSFGSGDDTFERIESKNASLDRKFGTMIFDANAPNVITDTDGNTFTSSSVGYLSGQITKGTFWKDAGILKPLKGFDFDQKRLEFSPPIGKLDKLHIKFENFSSLSDGRPELYNFGGKNHLLIFSVRAEDNQSGQKW